MTDISKEAVDALLQGVTDGPWIVEAETLFGKEDGYTVDLFDLMPYETNECYEADASFIAAARELVPALRAALDEAEARAVKAEAERERLALAICGGEDVPGYANAASVDELEGIARKTASDHMATINMMLRAEAERDAANALLREIEPHLAEISGFFFDTFPRKEIRAHLGDKP